MHFTGSNMDHPRSCEGKPIDVQKVMPNMREKLDRRRVS
jgi:hypothetical protein